MTVEQLVGAVAGVILSLLFSYVPGLRDRYGAMDAAKKSFIMLGLLFVASIAVFGLSCIQVVNAVECSQAGAISLAQTFFYTAVANQTAYRLSPQITPAAKA